jgi:hypothetical protein
MISEKFTKKRNSSDFKSRDSDRIDRIINRRKKNMRRAEHDLEFTSKKKLRINDFYD